MRIILVSCLLLSTCSLIQGAEYVEGVQYPRNPRKEKRFIFFNKYTDVQRLIQGLVGFSRIASNPSPTSTAAPTTKTPPSTTSAPTTTTAPATTTAAPPTTAVPCNGPKGCPIDGSFDGELDYLTHYQANAYALPQPQIDNLSVNNQSSDNPPPLIKNPLTAPYSLPQYSANLHLGVQPSPLLGYPIPYKQSYNDIYSQPLPYHSSLSQVSFYPSATQSYIPKQQVLFIPLSKLPLLTYDIGHQKRHSYLPHFDTTDCGYHQSRSSNHFSFSNDLPHSAHTQTAYFGNHDTGYY